VLFFVEGFWQNIGVVNCGFRMILTVEQQQQQQQQQLLLSIENNDETEKGIFVFLPILEKTTSLFIIS